MENQDYNLSEENKPLQEEHIPNIEQFQVERSGPNDEFNSDLAEPSKTESDPKDVDEDTDASEYSEDEVEYADGEGTLLNEEFKDEDEKEE